MRTKHASLYTKLLLVCFVALMTAFPLKAANCADDDTWYVRDVIEPTLDQVKWSETGGIALPASWIADGSWEYASLRESLVGKNDIFVSTYEQFNWGRIRSSAENYYGADFGSFGDFVEALQTDAAPWLDLSWQMDTQWYGISPNTTKVTTSFNQTSSQAEIWTYFHITRIPEYLVGQGELENWLTGFDLTPVSTGSLTRWELYEDWGTSGTIYNLNFEAPASLLAQHGANFTFSIGVSSHYRAYTFKIQQEIDVNMPAATEVKEASPAGMVAGPLSGNTAYFLVMRGEPYPDKFEVLSGPPAKSFGQTVAEGAAVWFFTPPGWAAIGSLLVLSFTALRGRKVWRRSRTYHRLYKSMVTLFDLYARDHERFHMEMDNVSKSIFKMLVDDHITDDQFEKLLKRRDDLLERSDKLQPPPPPSRT
ncbi:MAG: hypothetical protein ACE14S_01205 [Candidatus Bathyarchaeia archaeon]